MSEENGKLIPNSREEKKELLLLNRLKLMLQQLMLQ